MLLILKQNQNNDFRTMNLQEAIEARHSVRKYIDKPISQDIMAQLIILGF